jgi:hypothetical protein
MGWPVVVVLVRVCRCVERAQEAQSSNPVPHASWKLKPNQEKATATSLDKRKRSNQTSEGNNREEVITELDDRNGHCCD